MPRYNSLRTMAFRIAPDAHALPHTYMQLEFPERWKAVLRELNTVASGRRPEESRLPIRTLNKALRALAPDLISIMPDADKSGARPWLYSATATNPQVLRLIVHAWAQVMFANADATTRRSALADLKPDHLRWVAQTINVADWHTATNGTAEPGQSDNFIVLPDVLAARLSQSDVVVQFGAEPLRFRRAPLAPGGKGAELVSWPPLQHVDRRGSVWYYSVVVIFTVQTVPFQAYPVVHCDMGLRRWASRPITFLPGGEETSVYLLTSVPWLEGVQNSTSFQVAPIRWERVNGEDVPHGHSPFRLTWGSKLAPILDNLHPQHPFPAPQALIDDPVTSMGLASGPNVVVNYRYGIRPDHRIAPGLMPRYRRMLAEQIATLLAPEFVFIDTPMRQAFRSAAPANPFFAKGEDETESSHEQAPASILDRRFTVDTTTLVQRKAAIAQAVGSRLTIELRYQSAAIRNALAQVVSGYLGLPQTATFPVTWSTPELTLTLRAELLGAIGDSLQIAGGSNRRDLLHQAIRHRIEQIASHVPREDGVIATFVELAGAAAFSGMSDPKHALRAGFAQIGRLTQFLTTGEQERLDHRAINGFLDMLRQLGVSLGFPRIQGLLPEPMHLVGLWLIKQFAPSGPTQMQRMLPVMVHIDGRTGQIRATAPGLETWLPYPQALLAIAQTQVQGRTREFERPRDAMRFIRPTLERDVVPLGDTLLICHAQNLRSAWPWLGNGRIVQDALFFGEEAPQPITTWPGLRIVRVRDSGDHETPEWYAESGEEQGFARGLFQIGERVFASTHEKPHQFKTVSRNAAPEAQAWNPGLFELTVAGLQPGDLAWPWAALVHELRRAALHYDAATALPLPLHLARGIDEYVLPLYSEEEVE